MLTLLDFEKPIAELEGKIEELRHMQTNDDMDIGDEIEKLEAKLHRLLQTTYSKLSPWQKAQVARHPNRPHAQDYISTLIENFTPLAGDRSFAEDSAILSGLGRFRGRTVMVLGQEKGNDTPSRLKHNFGMAKPEGYRKAIRLMRQAEHFKVPVMTFVDTSGAFPGIEAEARGQAEAIAQSIHTCLDIKVPIVSVVIGEGGSGGAIALAASDEIVMLEHSIYSVISPEGCASILWRSADFAADAAQALRLTAQDLKELGVIDAVVAEPLGGAHRQPKASIMAVGDRLEMALKRLSDLDAAALVSQRHEKFLAMGKKGLES